MKKILKLFVCAMMAFALVACGGGSSSDDSSQVEAVVNEFFDAIAVGDIDKAQALCLNPDDTLDQIASAVEEMESELIDEAQFGDVWVKEGQGFIDNFFAKLIQDRNIASIEKDGDNYIVKVDAKIIDGNTAGITLQSRLTSFMNTWQSQHMDDIRKMTSEKELYAAIAPELFAEMNKVVDEASTVSGQFQLTLEKSGDSYKISKIQ